MSNRATTTPLLSIAESAIYYRDQKVLTDVELEIHQGERIALLGKSGAGKSTLLKLLYQHLNKDKQHRIASVPQQLGLVDKLSCFHNIYMGQLDQHNSAYNLLNLAWPQSKHKQAISALLEQLHLQHELFKPVHELSGGQQQRIAIARAIYSGADIILADEPGSNLDEPMAKKVIELILQHSHSTVIALHDTELALRFSDRIIGIDKGKIVLNASTNTIELAQLEPLYEHH